MGPNGGSLAMGSVHVVTPLCCRRFLKWSVYLRLAYPEMYTASEGEADNEAEM
jgi:hypothetical protein